MNANSNQHKALVTVFEDVQTAEKAAAELQAHGYSKDRMEIVTHDVHTEAPQVETPKVHETTASSLVDSAAKWGGIGAATGAAIGLLTPFPGLGLGMAIMGGVTGSIMGGMAGVEHAAEDDSVDLPSLEEYEGLVTHGNCLFVFLGTHNEVIQAEKEIKKMHDVRGHIHVVHGHLYHEHPAHQNPE